MQQMSEEEMKSAIEENPKLYVCPTCLTQTGTGESKAFFCGMGKSEIISEEKGCTYPECPVTEKMGLRWQYYCIKGTGREQLALETSGWSK